MVWHAPHATLRIAVLAGGDSAEREISLQSGATVVAALEQAGHEVQQFDPAGIDLALIPWCQFDACFIALHGGAGEDGRIQRRLEMLRVPYTGSGPAASRLAMSKSASKERFLQAGVATAAYVLFQANDPLEQVVRRVQDLGYPLILKPDSQGSSLGVNRVEDPARLAFGLEEARRYDNYILAESFVQGREFTVAVMGRQALPPLEILAPGGIFDYDAKYANVTTQYRFDCGLREEKLEELQQLAVAAADCLGTQGLVRADLMLDDFGRPWVLEVNTVPGLTQHSLAPKAAAESGLELPVLCEWMVRDCLAAGVSS